MNKIALREMMQEKGIPVIPLILASHDKIDFVDYIKDLNSYVAKPSHMSQNHGLIIFKDGINQISSQPITAEEVVEEMNSLIDTPSNSDEWLLQNMPRGFLVQEYIEGRIEMKFQTIWGEVLSGSLLLGETMEYKYYNVNGEPIGVSQELASHLDPNLWQEGIKLAEQVAQNTDALRVDILVKKNPDGNSELMLNEVELRSQLGWPNKQDFMEAINSEYSGNCVVQSEVSSL